MPKVLIPYVNAILSVPPVIINGLRFVLTELEREMFAEAREGVDENDPINIPFRQIESLLAQREARLAAQIGVGMVKTGVAVATNVAPIPGLGAVTGVFGTATTGLFIAESMAADQSKAVKAAKTRTELLSGGKGAAALKHDPKTALLSLIKTARDNPIPENPAVKLIESFGIRRQDMLQAEPQDLLDMLMMVLDLSEDPTNIRGTLSGGLDSVGDKPSKLKHLAAEHGQEELSEQDQRAKADVKAYWKTRGLKLKNVEGAGLNSLIRSLLLASGHEADGKMVSMILQHLESRHILLPNSLLEINSEAGEILLTELVQLKLLDPEREIRIYTPAGGRQAVFTRRGEVTNPIRLWLEPGRCSVILPKSQVKGKVDKLKDVGHSISDAAATTRVRGRAHKRAKKTAQHLGGIVALQEQLNEFMAQSDLNVAHVPTLRTLLEIVRFVIYQKDTKLERAQTDEQTGLLSISNPLAPLMHTAEKQLQGTRGRDRERYARALVAIIRGRGPWARYALELLHNLFGGDKATIDVAISHDEGWQLIAEKLRST